MAESERSFTRSSVTQALSLSGGFCGELRCNLRGCEEEKKDAAEGGLAAGWVVPLLDGMDVAADASGADGEGGNAEGERQIGVGGAEALLGGEGEVTIDGAEGGEQGGVVGQ